MSNIIETIKIIISICAIISPFVVLYFTMSHYRADKILKRNMYIQDKIESLSVLFSCYFQKRINDFVAFENEYRLYVDEINDGKLILFTPSKIDYKIKEEGEEFKDFNKIIKLVGMFNELSMSFKNVVGVDAEIRFIVEKIIKTCSDGKLKNVIKRIGNKERQASRIKDDVQKDNDYFQTFKSDCDNNIKKLNSTI